MHALAQNRFSKQNCRGLGAAALFLIALTACSKPTTVEFANATSSGVTLFYKDRHVVATLPVPANSTVRVNHLLDVHFSIRMADSTKRYRREVVPEAYIADVGFGPFLRRIVKAQLEADGCVYLLSRQDDIPNRRHEAQPDGFPLCPMSSEQ